MTLPPVPKCGSSDARNEEYENNFSYEKYYALLLNKTDPIIFDVGAHRGESIRFFRSLFDSAEIFSFEPEVSNYEVLKDVASDAKARAFNLAMSNVAATVPFYKQDISHLGGLVPINEASCDSLGYAERAKNERIDVQSTTIDIFCEQAGIEHIDLLKIDVQGHEGEVLEGADSMLLNTNCVTAEVSLYDFYGAKPMALLNVERRMVERGFSLWDIAKISKNPKNFRTDWIEVVYKKL